MFLPSISRNDSFLFEPIYLYVFWASSLKGTSAFFALLFNLFPLFWEWGTAAGTYACCAMTLQFTEQMVGRAEDNDSL